MAARRPIRRRLRSAVALAGVLSSAALPLAGAARAWAADPAVAAADAAQAFAGVVNADRTLVYSGPKDDFYATARLEKGAKVQVVGVAGAGKDFYKIVPPDGSFSFVSKVYVERSADGSTGKVTAPDLNVRAGSTLNTYKTTVQAVLDKGETVKILGEQDGYYKIVPPTGATLYVARSAIDPVAGGAVSGTPLAGSREPAVLPTGPLQPAVPPTDPTATAGNPPAAQPPVAQPPVAQPPVAQPPTQLEPAVPPTAVAVPPVTVPPVVAPPPAGHPEPTGVGPTTGPSPVEQPPVSVVPATQPAKLLPERFDAAEAAFATASKQPLDQQPLDGLRWRYRTFLTDPALTPGMKQVVDARLSTLELRLKAKAEYVAVRTDQDQGRAKRQALRAEMLELAQRASDKQVTTYAAVGTLRVSSLQQSGAGGTLYRLTDPGTGRTVLYLRSADPKYADLLNQFIGVNGDVTEDAALGLKYIAPTSAEAVDPAKVNGTISATLVPPSMAAKAATPAAAQ